MLFLSCSLEGVSPSMMGTPRVEIVGAGWPVACQCLFWSPARVVSRYGFVHRNFFMSGCLRQVVVPALRLRPCRGACTRAPPVLRFVVALASRWVLESVADVAGICHCMRPLGYDRHCVCAPQLLFRSVMMWYVSSALHCGASTVVAWRLEHSAFLQNVTVSQPEPNRQARPEMVDGMPREVWSS